MANNNINNNNIPNHIHRLHQIAAYVSLVLLPLPGLPAKIGLIILFVGLLRIPTTIKSFGELLKMPIFLLFVIWWLIAVISGTWATHPTQSLLASPVLLLIIPSLFPVLKQPRKYILAIGLGAVIHTAIQAITWLGIVEGIRYLPMTVSGGLHWYPPFTSLWSTCALLLLLGLILNANSWKMRFVPLLIAIPLPVSLVLAGTRVLYIIFPLAIILLMVRLLMLSSTRVQKITTLSVCTGIIIVGLSFLLIPGSIGNQNLSRLANEVSSSTGNSNSRTEESRPIHKSQQFVNSVGLRYLWWNAGVDIWKKSPWLGHGNGSTKYQLAIHEAEIPTKYGADVSGFLISDPHSSILATAIEQGLLGSTAMALLSLLAFLRSWRRSISTPSLVGLSACWLTVIAFSFVHTIQFSDYASTLVVILVSFTVCIPKTNAINSYCNRDKRGIA